MQLASPRLGSGSAAVAGALLGIACPSAAYLPVACLIGLTALRTPLPGVVHAVRVAFVVALMAGAAGSASERSRLGQLAMQLPPPGTVAEGHFSGRLQGGAERTFEGGRRLRLIGRFDLLPLERPDWRLEVVVAPSPDGPTARLDDLAAGDRVRVWCRASRPRGFHNPTSVDPSLRMRAAGVDLYGSIKSARLVELVASGEPSVARAIAVTRRELGRRLNRVLGPTGDRRAVLGAVLLGERSALRPEVRRGLRDAGLAHLIAISGLHVGLIAWLIVAALERLPVSRIAIPFLVAILLPAFALVVGARPSVLRAAASATLWVLARGRGRDASAMNTLGLVAAGLLIVWPRLIGDSGFQLTFVATAGILALATQLGGCVPLPRPAAAALGASVSAYALTAPVVAWHFGRLAPIALVTNLVVLPLCGLMLLAGYAAILLEGLPLGGLAAGAAESSAAALLRVAELAAALSGGAYPVSRPPWAIVIGCLVALGWVAWSRSSSVAVARSARALVAALLVWIHLGGPPAPPGGVDMLMLDVGQGQSVALRSDGRTVLIDAGGARAGALDPGEREVVPSLLAWSGRRLEILVVSHEHIDHAGGAAAVLRDLEVGELWVGPGYHRSDWMTHLATQARKRGTAVVLAARGTHAARGRLPIRVLSPASGTSPAAGPNSRSLVVLLGTAPTRVLIPGDIARSTELELAASGQPLEAEVLVLSHHGSRTGSTATFLSRVCPRIGLVSCGYRNRFGHPHRETLTRFAAGGRPLLRTDRRGALELSAAASGWRTGNATVDRNSRIDLELDDKEGERDEAQDEDQ